MADTMQVAIFSFIFGALFFEIAKRYVKRPRGYVRLKHKNYPEYDMTERTSKNESVRPDSGSTVRSKFDYLFSSKAKGEKPKIDLASVERSFTPDPKPIERTFSGGSLQNKYLDLSHLVDDDSSVSSTESRSYTQPYSSYTRPQERQYPAYPQSSQSGFASSFNSQFSQNSASATPDSSQGAETHATGFKPYAQPSTQNTTSAFESTTVKKEEKEHEWKPMGFFDD